MHILTFTYITSIVNGGHFEKWPPRRPRAKSQRAQYPNLLRIYLSTCVQNFMLLEKSEQLFSYAAGLD